MRRALSSILIAMTLGWSGAVHAGDFQKGFDAFQVGDYSTALREFSDLAEQGNAGAQAILGAMYHEGIGVKQDYAEALKWFRPAAEQGVSLAQIGLFEMYVGGEGVAQNYVTARMWLNIAEATIDASDADAANFKEKLVLARELATMLLGNTQIAEAQKMAREWMEKHPRQ